METPIRARVNAKPRWTIAVMRCDNSILPQTVSAISILPLASLAAHVTVPVQGRVDRATLSQETAPEWDRQLVVDHRLGAPRFSSPVILSTRNRWHIHDNTSEVFDRALVVDGAKRLEAAFAFPSPGDIPVTIVYGLSPRIELELRRLVQDASVTSARIETRERVGTSTPRLTVGEQWVEVHVSSDPFVVPTLLGYSPAILVRKPAGHITEHILIGAKSLATELETLRRTHGTLTGAHVRIRKKGSERLAPYEVEIIK